MAKTTTKLDRLTMLRATLIECKKDSLKDADEWMTYNDMQHRIEGMLHEERVACGWSGVYEIVNGCAGDCLFEGDSEQCKIYADIMLGQHPERRNNIIISPLFEQLCKHRHSAVEDLHMAGGVAYIQGHVEDLHMNGGVVYNYGHIDDMHQNGGIQYGTREQQPQTRVEYRDRVVEKRVDVVQVVYRDREKIVYRDNNETAHVRDLLDAAMEVNRRQAERIKELERIISEHREAETPDPWDVKPTHADCERLLKQFDIFTHQ